MFFVVALFFLKNKTTFKNEATESGLVYGGAEKIGDLVSKDNDKDGILDWEESLWGTDPTKKDTNDDGVSDSVEIEKIKSVQVKNTADYGGVASVVSQDTENLTETDKLSRELFSTIATLNQVGDIDQDTVDKLSSSLAERIQNSTPKKVFSLSDMKVIKDDSAQAVKNYDEALNKIYNQSPIKYTVLDVLAKFIVDENNVDESVLPQLDPLIIQTNKIISALVKISVPPSLASLHLEVINELQKLSENMSDIRTFNTDVVVAFRGLTQYDTTTDDLLTAMYKLARAIDEKLNN